MTRALTLLVKIARYAKEAKELLVRTEDKQAAAEIRFAAEAVLEANKWKSNEKRTHRDN